MRTGKLLIGNVSNVERACSISVWNNSYDTYVETFCWYFHRTSLLISVEMKLDLFLTFSNLRECEICILKVTSNSIET